MIETKNYINLENENKQLKKRISYLEQLLDNHHITYQKFKEENQFNTIKTEMITPEHAVKFYRVFKGRKDVYSQRHVNKDGKVGYYPQCENFWKEEVNALRKICQLHHIDYLVERSRSGKGAHLWIFFDEPISAILARRFGRSLLNIEAESINLKTFKTYDRMIPNQDHLSDDGLANLIALPLQGQA